MNVSPGQPRSCPGVTVVVPCYNASRFVEFAVRSVLDQDGVEVRVVVVDDGSTDGSSEILEQLATSESRVRLVRQQNGGVATARNAGIAEAGTDALAIAFLDADDVMLPGALRRLAGVLEQRHDVVAVAGTCERIDAAGAVVAAAPARFRALELSAHGVKEVVSAGTLTLRNLLPSNAITTPGQCLVRREAIGDEPFDARFSPCEDWDFWLRLTSAGAIATIDDVVLRYRDHAGGLSKQYDRMRHRRVDVLAAHRARSPEDDDVVHLIDAAYWFVGFRYDRDLNLQWAASALRRREFAPAARFASRALQLASRSALARVRASRVPWWIRRAA